MKTLGNILIGGAILGSSFLNPIFGQKKAKASDYVQGKILNKHYAFDESDLTKEDSVYVAKYSDFADLEKYDIICVEGYASSPGTEEYNDSLSRVRAEKLEDYLHYLNPKIKTKLSYFGEVNRQEEVNDSINNLDQVVKVIPFSNNLENAFNILKANPSFDKKKVKQALLLDKSWSMGRNGAWDFLQGYDCSDFDDVHAFSRNKGEQDTVRVTDIKSLEARGATCYFSANYKLLSDFNNGDILTVINGRDNVGEIFPVEIVKKALENNVSLSYLYLSPDSDDFFGRLLREMAHKTRGSFTCVKTIE
jgi:hypothetical protein